MIIVFGTIMLLAGMLIFLSATPTLFGLVTKYMGNNTSYVLNTSGCFYKVATGAGGDVIDPLGLICLIGTIGPIMMGATFFVIAIMLIYVFMKKYVMGKEFG